MKQCVCAKARCVCGVGSVDRIQYDSPDPDKDTKIRFKYAKCKDAEWHKKGGDE
jgi:hypothetical protein